MTEANETPAKPKKKKWKIFLIVLGVLIIIGAVFGEDTSTTSDSTSTPREPEKVASFSGEVGNWQALNPASGTVTFSITNTGEASGVPDCKVRVQDDSGTYVGYDYPIFENEVAPGETVNGKMTLTVTKEGAAFITRGEVTCD